MKKTLIALAAVSTLAAGTASAQVTLSGAFGFGYSASGAAGSRVTGFGRTDGNLTFAASEDLGGGMKISVSQKLDLGEGSGASRGAVGVDSNNLTLSTANMGTFSFGNVNRGGTERLSGGESLVWGINEMFGGADGWTQLVTWTAPTINNFTFKFTNQYNPSLLSQGVFELGYANGPLAAKVDYVSRTGRKLSRLMLSYDAGVAKVSLTRDLSSLLTTDRETEFAVTAPLGAMSLGLHYGRENGASGIAVAANYSLSKRTVVNTSIGSFSGNAAQKSGARLKVVHSF